MPLPAGIGQFNKRLPNRILSTFAGTLPPFAIIEHRGRRSGHLYRTPVMAFPRNGEYLVALTYGAETDWVKNILAAGGCALIYRGRHISCRQPQIVSEPAAIKSLPLLIRGALKIIRVGDVLRLSATP